MPISSLCVSFWVVHVGPNNNPLKPTQPITITQVKQVSLPQVLAGMLHSFKDVIPAFKIKLLHIF